MDGGVDILPDNTLTDEDGILVVVAVPGNEAYENVAAEGQLTVLGSGSVCKNGSLLHLLTDAYDGLLVETCIVIRALELMDVVCIDLTLDLALCLVYLNPDLCC